MSNKALLGTVSRITLGILAAATATSGACAQSAGTVAPPRPPAQTTAPADDETHDIIVTAQKRSERIRDVGMSIQALSSQSLVDAGVAAPQDLVKVVPGFASNPTPYGANVYTLRGIGYQETTLSAAPTVTVYSDEVPIPFSPETLGTALDLERVEVLKGPQGTLYGQNSTGGLINFIAARPTDRLSAGGQVSYGSFDAVDVEGYLSGPLTDTLKARAAFKVSEGGAWQKSYTTGAKLGERDLLNGRLLIDWNPGSRFHASLNISGWRDHGETPAPQFFGLQVLTPGATALMPPGLVAYPTAPHDNRAADWDQGVDYHRRNSFFFTSLKLGVDITDDVSLTTLTSYQRFKRDQPVEGDGTAFEDYSTIQQGDVKTWYQEARLAGTFGGRGNWMLGGNYEHDTVFDQFRILDKDGSLSHVLLSAAPLVILNLPGNFERTDQTISTGAIFGNVEYPVTSTLKLQGSARYTRTTRDFFGQAFDGVNGNTAFFFTLLQAQLRAAYGVFTPSGQTPGLTDCLSLGAAPTFLMGCRTDRLKEDNVSWRVGLNWKASKDTLLYANVSQGYKAGSFPTIIASTLAEMDPVTQERVTAYEAGVKTSLFDRTFDLTAAAFYYDYKNKQTIGRYADIAFGTLLKLINVPKSRVAGFEVAAAWRPVPGLTISPVISYIDTKVLGSFRNFDYLGQPQDFGGRAFPLVPKVQGSLDAQYRWSIGGDAKAFLGGNLAVQGKTWSGFIPNDNEKVPAYTVLDLRAGVEKDGWRFSVWGRNVTDSWYWTSATRINDALVRQTGMPRTIGATIGFAY
ncbi:TonB-dependent receptor [Sphingomonas sp. RP10(2022)]|uniref:TonB-dependent receptor n=1 Tax=Sphingomonas liriopis TaxID=2949094 RepID=A0A9X2HWW0_9SPHN|nr:TonB-dependent receptor [Sphingomonas liriopis]MCP3734285.1 TonB-dependent receptor [Sphingomonas liriopis]